MKIKIESDVFDISKRIKDINENYFIMYDLDKKRFELHCLEQTNTYCFSYPFENLDNRFIKLIHDTKVENIDKIIQDIDNNNNKIENNINKNAKNKSECMIKDIYNFSNISSKNFDESKAFSSVWR